METKPNRSVSLVLGSGGARGLAHIGIIHWLEEHDFKIDSICGCSMGSVIGGIYGVGKLDDFENWVKTIKKVDIISLLDIAWSGSGLVKGDKIINALIELVGDHKIEDLSIPFTAVAADIKGEREVWLNSGRLFDAIRASISLPLFFTPFTIDGIDLIDGGVLNPVPIAPAFGDDTDMIIAVNLGGPFQAGLPEPEPIQTKTLGGNLIDSVQRFIDNLGIIDKDEKKNDWSMYAIADQAFDAMQGAIARQKLAAYPPDHSIIIPRNACGTLEFDRAEEMINLGYQKAAENLSHLIHN